MRYVVAGFFSGLISRFVFDVLQIPSAWFRCVVFALRHLVPPLARPGDNGVNSFRMNTLHHSKFLGLVPQDHSVTVKRLF
jgi:hypothetical protein